MTRYVIELEAGSWLGLHANADPQMWITRSCAEKWATWVRANYTYPNARVVKVRVVFEEVTDD